MKGLPFQHWERKFRFLVLFDAGLYPVHTLKKNLTAFCAMGKVYPYNLWYEAKKTSFYIDVPIVSSEH